MPTSFDLLTENFGSAGFLPALFFGYFFSIVIGSIFIWLAAAQMWRRIEWQADTKPNPHPHRELGLITGAVERILYTTAILIGQPEFIAVWLAFKAITPWRVWDQGGEKPGELPGRSVFQIFMINNGASVAFGIVGAWVVLWLKDGHDQIAWFATEWLVLFMLVVIIWELFLIPDTPEQESAS